MVFRVRVACKQGEFAPPLSASMLCGVANNIGGPALQLECQPTAVAGHSSGEIATGYASSQLESRILERRSLGQTA